MARSIRRVYVQQCTRRQHTLVNTATVNVNEQGTSDGLYIYICLLLQPCALFFFSMSMTYSHYYSNSLLLFKSQVQILPWALWVTPPDGSFRPSWAAFCARGVVLAVGWILKKWQLEPLETVPTTPKTKKGSRSSPSSRIPACVGMSMLKCFVEIGHY